MKAHPKAARALTAVAACALLTFVAAAEPAADAPALPVPQPLTPGAKVMPLWPVGSPALKVLEGSDKPEQLTFSKDHPDRVQSVVNVHNPSLEVHLPPPGKANGMAVVVAPGGGNKQLVVGSEGLDIAEWLNGLGIAAFIERYRLQPYDSTVDAVADTQRSIRLVRAHAKEWNVDPARVGIMGFSAGGGIAVGTSLAERSDASPDFLVSLYGPSLQDVNVPAHAPPLFVAVGSSHFNVTNGCLALFAAWKAAGKPAEIHVYDQVSGGFGMTKRGLPVDSWNDRLLEWLTARGLR